MIINKSFQLLPDQASTIAQNIDQLYIFLIGLSVFFTALIFGLILLFSVRYRKNKNKISSNIHGSNLLEILWSTIPLGICLVIFLWGSVLFFRSYKIPEDAKEIFVIGKQWMWKIQHPEGMREINELHVPINQKISLTITSEDVVHSFFIPAFRIKMDAVPGVYTRAWFEANKVGSYHLFCAEYCGTKHSEMIGKVVVMEENDYQQWLSERSNPASANVNSNEPLHVQGQAVFNRKGCIACHQLIDSPTGPNLHGLFGNQETLNDGTTILVNESYIRESILNPTAKVVQGFNPIMPTFEKQITEEELLSIIEYIKTLKLTNESN